MGTQRDRLAVHKIEAHALDSQVIQLRPTTKQYALSALGKAMCAAPVFIAIPVVDPVNRNLLLTMALLSALAAFLIDLAANRDVKVDVSRAGLGTRVGLIPWWVIDEIEIRNHVSERTVRVCAFETLEIDLAVPRSGSFTRNPAFDEEARLIIERWVAHRDQRPLDPLGLRTKVRSERRDSEGDGPTTDGLAMDDPVIDDPVTDDSLIDLVERSQDAPSAMVARALERGRDRVPSSKSPLV